MNVNFGRKHYLHFPEIDADQYNDPSKVQPQKVNRLRIKQTAPAASGVIAYIRRGRQVVDKFPQNLILYEIHHRLLVCQMDRLDSFAADRKRTSPAPYFRKPFKSRWSGQVGCVAHHRARSL